MSLGVSFLLGFFIDRIPSRVQDLAVLNVGVVSRIRSGSTYRAESPASDPRAGTRSTGPFRYISWRWTRPFQLNFQRLAGHHVVCKKVGAVPIVGEPIAVEDGIHFVCTNKIYNGPPLSLKRRVYRCGTAMLELTPVPDRAHAH